MEPALYELIRAGQPDDEVAVLLRLAGGSVPDGVRIVARFGPIATARVRRRAIGSVRAAESVLSMKAPRVYRPDWLPALPAEADDIDLRPGDQRRPERLALTGRGIVVALVDWGLDVAHPDFRNEDGTTRILALWDQRARTSGSSNSRYGYGWVHDWNAINAALRKRDPYAALNYHPADAGPGPTHGTHTAAIAAGNGRGGGPQGLAPQADIVFVHLATAKGERGDNLGDSVALIEAIDFIATMAGPRPWVLNLSMGLCAGPHDGSTLVEQAIDAALAAVPGRSCVQSTGNYFSRPIHTQGVLRPGEIRDIGFHTGDEDGFAHEIDVWYAGRDRVTLEVIAPSDEVSGRVVAGDQNDLIVAGQRVGRLYNRRHDPNNHDNEAHIYIDASAPRGTWTLRLRGVDVIDGRFHCWVERDPRCSACQPAFEPSAVVHSSTTGTICNGFLTIAVGAYDAHRPEHPLATFSSSGPLRDGRLKPDIVAPGVEVLSARSAARQTTPDDPLLARMSGTSMAAPYVAGTVALMFEAAGHPLPVRRTRELLLRVAEPLATGESQARWGSGYANVAEAVAAATEERPRSAPGMRRECAAPNRVATGPREAEIPMISMVDPRGVEMSVEDTNDAFLGCGEIDREEQMLNGTPPTGAEPSLGAASYAGRSAKVEVAEAAVSERVRQDAAPSTTALGVCRIAEAITFETAKSFIRPRFGPVIENVFIGAMDRPASGPVAPRADRFVLVTGHTDTQGMPSVNVPLSQRRARAAIAVLTLDPDEWERIGKAEHWWRDTIEIEVMAAQVDGANDIQRIRNYQNDSVARLDLIWRYLNALRPGWLPRQSPPVQPKLMNVVGSAPGVLGCGQTRLHNPRPGAVEENRRAEFYFFAAPTPAIRDCAAYRSWQSTCENLIPPQIELLDEYGDPYVGPFELTLPTGQVLNEQTDTAGTWSRPDLPGGRYTLTVRGRTVDLIVP